MALGAIAIVARESIESRTRVIARVSISSGANYTTGGELVTPASLGLNSLAWLEVLSQPSVIGKWVRVDNGIIRAPKLIVGVEGAAVEAEAASNSDQSNVQVLVAGYSA